MSRLRVGIARALRDSGTDDDTEGFLCFGYDEAQIQSVAGGLILVGFVFVAASTLRATHLARKGDYSNENVLVLPIYSRFLTILCCLLVLRTLLFWFVPNDSHVFYQLELGPLNGLVAALRDGIAVFLAQRSAGVDAVRRTGLFALVWAVVQGMLGLSFVTSGYAAHAYWTTHDATIVGLHALLLLRVLARRMRRQCTESSSVRRGMPREESLARGDASVGAGVGDASDSPATDHGAASMSLILYSSYMILAFGSYGATMVNIVPHRIAGCWWAATDLSTYLLWPFVVYVCLRWDSLFWRRIGLGPVAGGGGHVPLLQDLPVQSMVLDFSRLSVGKMLAAGGSAAVYEATLDSSRTVAVKQFACASLTAADARSYMREISILGAMTHPRIVRLYGVVLAPPNLGLVMELAHRGSLFEVLHEHRTALAKRQAEAVRPRGARSVSVDVMRGSDDAGRGDGDPDFPGILPVGRLLSIAQDIFSGLAFLHGHVPPVLHGDIKSLNYLVTRDWHAKLCDFGESRFSENYSRLHHRSRLAAAHAAQRDHGRSAGRGVSGAGGDAGGGDRLPGARSLSAAPRPSAAAARVSASAAAAASSAIPAASAAGSGASAAGSSSSVAAASMAAVTSAAASSAMAADAPARAGAMLATASVGHRDVDVAGSSGAGPAAVPGASRGEAVTMRLDDSNGGAAEEDTAAGRRAAPYHTFHFDSGSVPTAESVRPITRFGTGGSQGSESLSSSRSSADSLRVAGAAGTEDDVSAAMRIWCCGHRCCCFACAMFCVRTHTVSKCACVVLPTRLSMLRAPALARSLTCAKRRAVLRCDLRLITHSLGRP